MKNQLKITNSLAWFFSIFFSLGSFYGQFKATNFSTFNGLETMNVKHVFPSPNEIVYIINNKKIALFDGREFIYVSDHIEYDDNKNYFSANRGSTLNNGSLLLTGKQSLEFKFDSLIQYESPDSSFLSITFESGKKSFRNSWPVDYYGRGINNDQIYCKGKSQDLSAFGVKHWYSENPTTEYTLQRCKLIGKDAFLYGKLIGKWLEILDKTGPRKIQLETSSFNADRNNEPIFMHDDNLIVADGLKIHCFKLNGNKASIRSIIEVSDIARPNHIRLNAFIFNGEVLLYVRETDGVNLFDLDGNKFPLSKKLSATLLNHKIIPFDNNYLCAYSKKNMMLVNLKRNATYSIDGLPDRLTINRVSIIGESIWVATTTGLWQIKKSCYSRLDRSFLFASNRNKSSTISINTAQNGTVDSYITQGEFSRGLFIDLNNIWMNRNENYSLSSIHYYNGKITHHPEFSIVNTHEQTGYFLQYSGQDNLLAMPNYNRSKQWNFVDPISGIKNKIEYPVGYTVQKQTFTDSTVLLEKSDSIFLHNIRSKRTQFIFKSTSDLLQANEKEFIKINTNVLQYDGFLIPSNKVDGQYIVYDLIRNKSNPYLPDGPTTKVNTSNYIYFIGKKILIFDKGKGRFINIQNPEIHDFSTIRFNCATAWENDVFFSTKDAAFRVGLREGQSDEQFQLQIQEYKLKSQAVKNMVRWKNHIVILTEAGIEYMRPGSDEKFELFQNLLPASSVDLKTILVGQDESLFITSDDTYLNGYLIHELTNESSCQIWLKSAKSGGAAVLFDPKSSVELMSNQLELTVDLVEYNGGMNLYGMAYEIRHDNGSIIREGSRSITMDNLKSGDYELRIWPQLKTGPKQVPEDALCFKFSVPKKFSEGSVFILLMFLSGGLLVWSIAKFRISVLKKRKQQLEQIVAERTQEVRKQKQVAEHQRDLAEEQKLIIEEKNTEILDSITYAKRLQDAILPPTRLIKEWLSNSFVFYRPKDIVAGDFYWLENHTHQQDGRNYQHVLFAVGDCTGHGVPGAMLSVVCTNALNDALKKYNLVEPSRILSKVADLVKQSFNSEGQDIQDGMDIALCSLDLKNKKLYFSGANRPLYLIRKVSRKNRLSGKLTNRLLEKVARVTIKEDESAVLYEFQGERKGIGARYDNVFSTLTIDVEEDDLIYLFSDGFVDQFGGPRSKKYLSSNFKKLLLDHCNSSIEDQKNLLTERFDSWKGDVEQIDDVCVVGVRVDKSDTFRLSKREIEMLNYLNQGLSSQEIAEQTFISVHTVNTHRKNMLNKLNAKNSAEALNIARKSGII